MKSLKNKARRCPGCEVCCLWWELSSDVTEPEWFLRCPSCGYEEAILGEKTA